MQQTVYQMTDNCTPKNEVGQCTSIKAISCSSDNSACVHNNDLNKCERCNTISLYTSAQKRCFSLFFSLSETEYLHKLHHRILFRFFAGEGLLTEVNFMRNAMKARFSYEAVELRSLDLPTFKNRNPGPPHLQKQKPWQLDNERLAQKPSCCLTNRSACQTVGDTESGRSTQRRRRRRRNARILLALPGT